MKCDHIRTKRQGDAPFFPNMLNNANVEVCLKEDVDAAIAELKQAIQIKDDLLIENGKEIGRLKAENERLKNWPHTDNSAVIDSLLKKLKDAKEHIGAVVDGYEKKLNDAEMKADLAECANTEYREDIKKLKAENERIRKIAMGNVEELRKAHEKELRATRRALWIARAERARVEWIKHIMSPATYRYIMEKWEKVERLCRAKADKVMEVK